MKTNIDLLTGKLYLFTEFSGSTGETGVTISYPEVFDYSFLPEANENIAEIYIVLNSSGTYLINRKEAGLYYSNGVSWSRLGNTPSFFISDNFKIIDGIDNTKKIRFNISNISSGTEKLFNWPDTGGTVALKSQVDTKLDQSEFDLYTHILSGDTAPTNTSLIWFNGSTNLEYYYDGSDWVSTQLFKISWNRDGNTNNNTFLKFGNTIGTLTRGVPVANSSIKVYYAEFTNQPLTTNIYNLFVSGVVTTQFTTTNGVYTDTDVLPSPLIINSGNNVHLSVQYQGDSNRDPIFTLFYRQIAP